MGYRTILVTGGAGFIGANFVHYVHETEPEVRIVNVDALTYAGSLKNVEALADSERHIFVHADIQDQERMAGLLREYDVTAVVHFAAESHVDRSIAGPMQFVLTNVVGTAALLEAARQVWLVEKRFSLEQVRFHHVSTDEVFGTLEPDDPPFCETTPYDPSSPYSASKAGSDHLVYAYNHTYGLPITMTNCTNNYGQRQFPEKLIPLMIFNALAGKPLPVYGDGLQIRDWLHVQDHCEGIWKVVNDGRIGETYCIGGNNQPTNLEIVKTICAILDQTFPESPNVPHEKLITYVTDRPGHDRRYAMSIEKIGRELGWEPRYDLRAGLEETIQWYLDNVAWVTAVSGSEEYQEWIAQQY